MSKPQKPRTAIALYYDGDNAPRITAKGFGPLADEIVALAEAHDVPLQQDPQLSALLAQLDLGEAVPETLYVAVAEVIAFAYMVTGRFPKGKQAADYAKPLTDGNHQPPEPC